ncbi:MAG: D-alanine--D-alanine ligase [Oscillospiraceae bacterium]|nr:D-alanine--D-alanine ligase [Oscillospiraceae bacterium]
MKKSLAILFGGVSSEHEVSRLSAAAVIQNTPKDLFDLHVIGITKDGRWFYFDGDVELIPDGRWESYEGLIPAAISPDRSVHGIQLFKRTGVQSIKIDVCFPVMHGSFGEDGTMQGLLAVAGIPCVGCDVASSAICMDKALTNTMLEIGKVPQAKFIWFYMDEFEKNTDEYINRIESELGYPCFIKPANAGSSVGISKAENKINLIEGIVFASSHDKKIVIEEGVTGAEVEVAVLGNREPIASVVGQIVPANDWYDYDAKYNNAASELYIPAKISEEKQQEVRAAAVRAYKLLGCSGLARVDFFVRESDGAVLLNEPNTIPGFTSISMYAKLFAASGIEYPQLITRLIEFALEK